MTGRWLKRANLLDETYLQGTIVPDPEYLIARLKVWEERPDLLEFPLKVNTADPHYDYHTEWDDFAVMPITTYEHWLKSTIKKDVKENLRRAVREGVIARVVAYDDNFVQGIKNLCDETPIRQGKRFWHHGKSFEAIKEVHGSFRDRAEFIGAYLDGELIGFLKMVYVDTYAKTVHVISKEKFHQKRPTNALIAKAVEVCAEKQLSHFIYGEYNFPGKRNTSLTEFKCRHGFQECKYPRYFVPLTLRGKVALQLGLHRGLHRRVPVSINQLYLRLRAMYYRLRVQKD